MADAPQTTGLSHLARPAAEHVLEQGQRLSDSVLWRLMRDFYDEVGVEAWALGVVPHSVTNNPRIARAAARVILGYLRDLCRAQDRRTADQPPLLDPEQPLYIVELGAGAGRFGFYFLKALKGLRGAEPARRLKICYVLTDFTRRNLEFWSDHPQLRPFLDEGVLDFAVLDAEKAQEIRLEHSGALLSAQTLRNPLVVLGNYVFDTLTADAFQVRQGHLLESLVTVTADSPKSLECDRYELLDRLRVRYEHREAGDDYYDSADWNRILREYRQSLGDTGVSLPVGAFRCLENLLQVSGGRLLLLATDKSFNHLEQFNLLGDPEPVIHGSFSLSVNFHALGRLCEIRGGLALHSSLRDSSLDHVALLQDPRLDSADELRLAFREAMDQTMPVDFLRLQMALDPWPDGRPLLLALEILRLSGWDPDVLFSLSSSLAEGLSQPDPTLHREFTEALERIWANYYHYTHQRDVAFEIARIFQCMSRFHEALRFYQSSLALFGEGPVTRYNMGLCYYGLGHLEAALDGFRQALEQAPDYSEARAWILRARAEKAAREELRREHER